MAAREPTSEDLEKIVGLLRRALTRLEVVERRLGAVEKRLHWLDDVNEEIKGMRALASRVAVDEESLARIVEGDIDRLVLLAMNRNVAAVITKQTERMREDVERAVHERLNTLVNTKVNNALIKRLK